jgi:hypothetical protein
MIIFELYLIDTNDGVASVVITVNSGDVSASPNTTF